MLQLFYQRDYPEAGVDEAGRGCLAGPVFAAAVILDTDTSYEWYALLRDSKKLPENMRDKLRILIEQESLAWAVAKVMPEEIDQINILNASFRAMQLAIEDLRPQPGFLLIDGNRFRSSLKISHRCMVKGDDRYAAIAAASILAKTHRDAYMDKIHAEFPAYGWDRNRAYGTPFHIEAMRRHGLSPHHRKSFQLRQNQLNLF